jgi:enoyl-CoA hydratase/carnithine racemase
MSLLAELVKAIEDIERKNLRFWCFRAFGRIRSRAEMKNLIDLTYTNSLKDLVISRSSSTRVPVIAAMEGHAVVELVMRLLRHGSRRERERNGVVFHVSRFAPNGCTTCLRHGGAYVANEMMFTGKKLRGKDLAEKVPISTISSQRREYAKARILLYNHGKEYNLSTY